MQTLSASIELGIKLEFCVGGMVCISISLSTTALLSADEARVVPAVKDAWMSAVALFTASYICMSISCSYGDVSSPL